VSEYEYCFENLSTKFKVHWNLTRITGTIHEAKYTFWIVCRQVILRMKNISDKICRENQSTRFVFNKVFFFDYRAVIEIMWKNIAERCSPQKIIWPILIACWVPKAMNTHSQSVILIGLPLQVGYTKVPECYITRTVSVSYALRLTVAFNE